MTAPTSVCLIVSSPFFDERVTTLRRHAGELQMGLRQADLKSNTATLCGVVSISRGLQYRLLLVAEGSSAAIQESSPAFQMTPFMQVSSSTAGPR